MNVFGCALVPFLSADFRDDVFTAELIVLIIFWKFQRHSKSRPVHAGFSSLLNLDTSEGENNVLYSVRISALDGKCNAGCSGVIQCFFSSKLNYFIFGYFDPKNIFLNNENK